MPVAYTVDDNNKASIIYPDDGGSLTVDSNNSVVFSCLTSSFKLKSLSESADIVATCLGGTKFRYQNQTYDYSDFMCLHMLRSTVILTNQKCHSENNTVVRIGYPTKRYFFTLYHACFDMKNKDTLYTWFYARLPFFYHCQQRKRVRRFFQFKELHGDMNLNIKYGKYWQVSINR